MHTTFTKRWSIVDRACPDLSARLGAYGNTRELGVIQMDTVARPLRPRPAASAEGGDHQPPPIP